MKSKVLITLLLCAGLLCVPLAGCGGGGDTANTPSSGDAAPQEQQAAGETPEEQQARYEAGYDELSELNTISNPDPLTADVVREIMGDEGVWKVMDEDSNWVPVEGTPVPGEEIDLGLSFEVEGITGSVLFSWFGGKNYETETYSSASNSFN